MAVLLVDRWFSSCSECGGNADPRERQHTHGGPGSGYTDESCLSATNGCGAVFEDIHVEYLTIGQTAETANAEARKKFWGDESVADIIE